MKINEVTELSKKRAEEIINRDGCGFLVPIYAVVETDAEGKVMRVSHDHLTNVKVIEK